MIVYIHTSPSGKRYVGITSQKPEQRWRNGNGYRNNEYFFRAIEKYGWHNFAHEILYTGLSEDDANRMEEKLINDYDLTNPKNGYNLHTGGLHHKSSDDTRRKISESRKGRYGGKDNPFFGKKHSEETLKQMRKQVEKYSLDGEYIETYLSVKDAAKSVGADSSEIVKVCKGKRKVCAGFQWKYSDDDKIILPYKRTAHNRRRVKMIDSDGTVVQIYDSLIDAGKHFGVNADKSIGDCCRGEQKIAYGYKWEYA